MHPVLLMPNTLNNVKENNVNVKEHVKEHVKERNPLGWQHIAHRKAPGVTAELQHQWFHK